jgi:hypothetical protein
VGEQKAAQAASGHPAWERGVYFLGKVVWAKGYTELLDRLMEHTARTGHNIPVDVFGSGPDLDAVQVRCRCGAGSRRSAWVWRRPAGDAARGSLQGAAAEAACV